MRFFIPIALLVFCLLAFSPQVSARQILTGGDEAMGVIIRGKGFVCDTCNRVYYWDTIHYGKRLKALCNNFSIAYQVIVPPDEKFIVTPWPKGD